MTSRCRRTSAHLMRALNLGNKHQKQRTSWCPAAASSTLARHTHDSIYEELEEQGADVLTLKLFEYHVRYEDLKTTRFRFPFAPLDDGLYVFHGPKLLEEGKDYTVDGNHVVFP